MNGQVERMNQTIIRMIGKLEQDKKARWSEHLPEMLAAYNGTRSAVTGYSPYFLLFGRKSRMPVDCLFPILRDSPHQAKMEVSVAAMQKRLKEAFTVARHLTSQEAARQRRYYDRKAGAVVLQPGDVVMVHTDGFVGKRKVKDRWEDGGFIVESQLEDWPVYNVRCLTSDAKQKPKYRILHRNCLLLLTNEDDAVVPGQSAQAKVSPVVSNAIPEAAVEEEVPSGPLPSLLTRQEGEMTSQVWLNGEFHTKPWTQTMSRVPESPPDQLEDEVSDLESGMSDSESGRSPMVTWPLGSTVCETSQMATGVWEAFPYLSIGLIPNVPTLEHAMRGIRLTSNGLSSLGGCGVRVSLGTSDPQEPLKHL